MIVATAGHVDHGKTLLVKALTGVDTDRLTEEKKKHLPDGFVMVKASRELLNGRSTYQDFALVLALAAAECEPGAIVRRCVCR